MEHMNDPKIISHLTSCAQPAVEGLRLGQAERISKSLAGSVCVCVLLHALVHPSPLSAAIWLSVKEKSTANVLQPLGIFKVHVLFLGALQCAMQTWQFKRKYNGGSCAACQWFLQSFALWSNQSCCSQAATCSLMLWLFSWISEVRIHDSMDDTLSNLSHSISYCGAYQFELKIRNVWKSRVRATACHVPVCIMGNLDRRSDSKFQHQDP